MYLFVVFVSLLKSFVYFIFVHLFALCILILFIKNSLRMRIIYYQKLLYSKIIYIYVCTYVQTNILLLRYLANVLIILILNKNNY